MPPPDFTELTFGFAFLRELEQKYVRGGRFPMAPEFISQRDEAKKGYDVRIMLANATPAFLQLKRSDVLVTNRCKEIKRGRFTAPRVYRMKLHQNNQYQQHRALQNLEAQGNKVFYVTSQIYTQKEFATAYSNRTIVSKASASFSPKEIILPNTTTNHHVSFQSSGQYGYVFSSEPNRFERDFPTGDSWLNHLSEMRQSTRGNLKSLEETVTYLKKQLPDNNPIHEMIQEQPIEAQASILAYFQLDAILTFVQPKE